MKKGGRRRGGWSTSFVEMRKTEEEIWREGWESGFGLAKFRILLDSELNFSYWTDPIESRVEDLGLGWRSLFESRLGEKMVF